MFDKPPFLDWALDRWKIVVIFLLFIVLLILSLFPPPVSDGSAQSQISRGLTGIPVATAAVPESTAPVTVTGGIAPTSSGAELGDRRSGTANTDPIFPLTLAGVPSNAIVPQTIVTTLEGTAAPGHRVEIRTRLVARPGSAGALNTPADERVVGTADVATDGRWRMPVEEHFEAGQYEITLVELDDAGAAVATGAPILITVLSEGEVGPLSLATPAIRFPSVGARLRSGRITFVGSGLPGMRVQLYLDTRMLGEATVNSREEWRLTPETDIAPGIYVARAMAMGQEGAAVAESSPVAFAVYDAPLGQIRHGDRENARLAMGFDGGK